MLLYRKHTKNYEKLNIKYKILVIIQIKICLNFHRILSTTEIFPIS